MHARLDQLLSLRDAAPVDADARSHVQHCAACLAELARLEGMREQLQALPATDPPHDVWKDIEIRAARRPRRRLGAGIAAAAVLVLALVGLIGFIGVEDGSAERRALAAVEPSSSNDDLAALIERSRELEAVLAYLPARPRVERVSTAATLDSIERRIQWLDWQLAIGPEAGLDPRQAQRLWIERVDLMDSLVKVRYAETAQLVSLERVEGL
jgi:hypothetical protein